MILPYCFKDTELNRSIAKGLIDNYKQTKGKELILVSINSKLQALPVESVESLKKQNVKLEVCQ